MDYRWIRYFLAAARHQHLGAAAEELAVSEPTISRCVANIEKDFKTKLFDRVGRNIRLNSSGAIVAERFQRALEELDDAQREVDESFGENRSIVAIGFLATLGNRLIPELIQTFNEVRRDVTFRLLQGPHPVLSRMLLSSDIDLCISAPRFSESKLSWQPLYNEELKLFVPKKHSLAKQHSVDLVDVSGEPMIALKKGYGLRYYLDTLALEAGFQPKVVFESEEVSTLTGLVGAGFGITLAPASSQINVNLVATISINAPLCFRTMGISWRKGRFLPPATVAFRDHVTSFFKKAGLSPAENN